MSADGGLWRLSVACCLVLVWSDSAAAEPLFEELNTLEQATVERILGELGRDIDESPEGKAFGQLTVVNLDVLDTGIFLDWFNHLHATTRPHIVEDEILWQPGDAFDREVVRETARNLRIRANFSVVSIVPLVAPESGVVDVLAITRDTWSLRLNSNLSFTDGVVNQLYLALTEANLLGLHKTVAAAFLYEQDTIQVGPSYIDPRLGRTRLQVLEEFRVIINHDDGRFEGAVNAFQFGLPLYRLDSTWGFRLAEAHDISVDRLFSGSELLRYDNPDTSEPEALPYEVDQREIAIEAVALYRAGQGLKHDLTFGYGLEVQHFEIAHDEGDDATRQAFARDLLPRSDLASFVTTEYTLFRPTFATLRNYDTFAFSEDFRTGPELFTELQAAAQFIGSDNDFLRGTVGAGYTHVADGFVMAVAAETGARWDLTDDDVIDRYVGGVARLASPELGPVRLHLAGRATVQFNRVTSALSQLGGDSGLRGFPSGAFLGESTILGHFEVRTGALEILMQYIGAVFFVDVGTIYDEGDEAPFLADVGVGLRWVAPQAQRFAYRFDYGFPLAGGEFFPGVFSFGLGQAF